MRCPHSRTRFVAGAIACALCFEAVRPHDWPPPPDLPHSPSNSPKSIFDPPAAIGSNSSATHSGQVRLADWE